MEIEFIKNMKWRRNLKRERRLLTEKLSELEGSSVQYEDILSRIDTINKILNDKKGISGDTKLIVGSQLAQSVWYSFNSEIMGKIFKVDPFHIRTKFR